MTPVDKEAIEEQDHNHRPGHQRMPIPIIMPRALGVIYGGVRGVARAGREVGQCLMGGREQRKLND